MSKRDFGRYDSEPDDIKISGIKQYIDFLTTISDEEKVDIDPSIDLSEIDNIQFWPGPDETDRYIIAVDAVDQPTQVSGVTANIAFYATDDREETTFIQLVNKISGNNYNNIIDVKDWLKTNNYWASYGRWLDYNNVSSGQYHSIMTNYDGHIWSWGYNSYGQLGNNTATDQFSPISILGTKKTFCKINAGYNHNSGIDYQGQVWSWGYNNRGQLGNNSITSQRTPVAILGTNKTFCEISVGQYFVLSIDYQGQLWSWGYNYRGQLGNDSIISQRTPVSILGTNKTFCEISNNYYHSVGIDNNGQVWTWGYNNYGQLGDNTITSRRTPVSILGTSKTFCEISTGIYHTLGIDYQGQVWGWGYNNRGQLGNNSITSQRTPVSILGTNKTFCKIYSDQYHNLAIDYQGQVWSWGYNTKGQFGNDSTSSKRTPVSIVGGKKTFCEISTGFASSIGLDYRGQTWTWGYNGYGQLGNLFDQIVLSPTSLLGTKKTFCSIVTAEDHTSAIEYDGTVWSWGRNSYGELGDGSTASRQTPMYIGGTNKTFCKIYTGQDHSTGIDYQGQVWSWGYNNVGQLGNNSTTSTKSPKSICGTKKTFCDISNAFSYSTGIDYQGQVWGWGLNDYGQLGDNSVTSRMTPVSILGTSKTFCKISTGYSNVLSIDYQGQVWGWGLNDYGQLGDNSVISKTTPVSILGTSKTFCEISSGIEHTIGLDYQGQVWCWGNGGSGKLGNNDTVNYYTPVSILGTKKTFCKISAGHYHSMGLDYQGKIWTWGNNENSQLGDGTFTSRQTPVNIYSIDKTFCHITAGYQHSIGIEYNGQVWGWGYNNYVQTGTLFYNKRTPIKIKIL